jgi:hypothetical protein
VKKIINLALLALCSIGLTVCPSDVFTDIQEDLGELSSLDTSLIRMISAIRSSQPEVDWDIRTGEIVLIENTYDGLMQELQGWSQKFLSEDRIYKIFFQNGELTEESAVLLLNGFSQGPVYIVEQKKDPRLELYVVESKESKDDDEGGGSL